MQIRWTFTHPKVMGLSVNMYKVNKDADEFVYS